MKYTTINKKSSNNLKSQNQNKLMIINKVITYPNKLLLPKIFIGNETTNKDITTR